MSNEHHSLSGRWTAARGMSNSTAPDGRPSGGAVRGRMPLDVKTIFKTGDGRESESLDEVRLHEGHPGMKPRERIAFCAYGRDRTHFVEPCREHPGPAYVTFTTQTERVYNITHLRCGDQECADRLSNDRQKASWVRAGRFEEGRFLIDGDKVGLVGSDGKLLKAMKQ